MIRPPIYSDLATITGEAGRRDRTTFVALTVFSTVLQAAATITLVPLLGALFGDDPARAWPWVGLMVALLALVCAADVLATRAGLRVGFGLLDAVEGSGLTAIRALDPAELHSEKASRLRDLVTRTGPESVSALVLLGSPLIRAVLMTPLLAAFLLLVAWQLALVALLGGVALFAALEVGRRAVARSEEVYAESGRELDDRVLEFAWAQPTLRSAGVGTGTLDAVLAQKRSRGLRLVAWQVPGETLFTVVLQLTLLAFGVTTAVLYLNGTLTGVTAAAMVVVLLRIVETTGSLSLLSTPLASAQRVLAELRDVVLEHGTSLVTSAGGENPKGGTALSAGVGTAAGGGSVVGGPRAVSVRGMRFDYPDGTRALHGLDLELPAGSTTVIVGASGSGKSTLLDILTGLREPTTGQVLLDGAPSTARERLSASSLVFQSTQLRPGTLQQNILGTELSATELDDLSDRAQLTDVLATLPHGWSTRVGEAGNALSGGERQRVGLARALAKPSGLLMVDEATSALDAITERAVTDALARLHGKRTTVIVTHRPALVALADRVVVLDAGRIVDSGPLDEVLARGGVFADLWRRWRESEGWQVPGGADAQAQTVGVAGG